MSVTVEEVLEAIKTEYEHEKSDNLDALFGQDGDSPRVAWDNMKESCNLSVMMAANVSPERHALCIAVSALRFLKSSSPEALQDALRRPQ